MVQHTAATGRQLPAAAIRLGAVFVVAAVAGIAAWLLLVRSSTTTVSPPAPAKVGAPATAISQQGLQTLAAALDHPIYWAGSKPNRTYELTQTPDGRIYIRYLPAGIAVGSPNTYLTIGTYPVSGAYAATRRIAVQAGSVRIPVGDGGIAFYRQSLPTNVYVAFPGSNYQVEVFDPIAADAHKLVSSGGIRKVATRAGAAKVPKTAAAATSPAALTKLSSRLHRPLYWAGARPGTTYELTQTPDGRVYVRYLPRGVEAGAARPYLTVATYPLPGAYATTRAAAKQAGTVRIPLKGGIAFYSKTRPTSVYVAFPGVNEQIEVFDPSPAVARKTVAEGKIHPVG